FVRQAQAGLPITVHGDGTQRRCFCHVTDVVRALAELMLTESSYGRVFNIGSTEEISIRELAHKVRDITQSSSDISLVSYDEAYEEGFEDMARRIPDTSRIADLLGWAPTRTLDQILVDVVEHERQQRHAREPARARSNADAVAARRDAGQHLTDT